LGAYTASRPETGLLIPSVIVNNGTLSVFVKPFTVSKTRMGTLLRALTAAFVCVCPAFAQTLVACGCDAATVCLSDVEMSKHAMHVEMEPDKMGNHSNRGVAVFQIGFDEKGRVTGADAISGEPLGISDLMAAVSKWKFKPVVVNGMKKRGCGKLSVRLAMRENVPSAEVLKRTTRD
jgi:hypothetical protein